MKKKLLLSLALITTLCANSQDYKIEHFKQLNKGDFKITRLLITADSVSDKKVYTFIKDFITELQTKLEENNIQFSCIRRGTADVKQKDSLFSKFNPNGVMKFVPSQLFIRYRGLTQKNGLSFNLGLSYRTNEVDKFTSLFQLQIGVMVDSFENSGKLAAQDVVEKMKKLKYITP